MNSPSPAPSIQVFSGTAQQGLCPAWQQPTWLLLPIVSITYKASNQKLLSWVHDVHSCLFFQQPPIRLDRYIGTRALIITLVTVTLLWSDYAQSTCYRRMPAVLDHTGAHLCSIFLCSAPSSPVWSQWLLSLRGALMALTNDSDSPCTALFGQAVSVGWHTVLASRFQTHRSWKLRGDSPPSHPAEGALTVCLTFLPDMNSVIFLLGTVNWFVPKILISGAHKNACEEQLFFVFRTDSTRQRFKGQVISW